jgi:hypothetical protein
MIAAHGQPLYRVAFRKRWRFPIRKRDAVRFCKRRDEDRSESPHQTVTANADRE